MPDLTKRYWCFGAAQYYPGGGMSDLKKTTDNIEETQDFWDENYQIVDMETRTIIREG